MSQKSVIVVTDLESSRFFKRWSKINQDIFSSLKDACNHYGWVYNTICRKGDSFLIDKYLVERKPILRKGVEKNK